MKKILFLLVVLLCSCTPAFVSSMNGVSRDLHEGLELYDKQDYAGAADKITRAIDNIPVADDMYKHDTSAYLRPEGLAAWERVKLEASVIGRAWRSHAYLHLGKNGEAAADANWIVDDFNKNRCARSREDDKKDCDAAVARAVYVRGTVQHASGNFKSAVEDYDWVVKNSSDLGWAAYEQRGRAYAGLNDFATAFAHFAELAKQYPEYAEAHALQCYAAYNLFNGTNFQNSRQGRKKKERKLDEIAAYCKKALELDPENALAKETAGHIGNIGMLGVVKSLMSGDIVEDAMDEAFKELDGKKSRSKGGK